jgi:F-type H+-transporting ATPase subunit gamma
MPSLKDLRDRKKSVESTRKITSAMKMVSAAKLRRAQDQAVAARPYAASMASLLVRLTKEAGGLDQIPVLMAGTGKTGKDETILLVLMTSDRGLCGGFNGSLIREARVQIQALQAEGKQVKILCVGRRGRDGMRREFGSQVIDSIVELGKPRLTFADAQTVCGKIVGLFEAGAFDRCLLVYSQFKSAMTQISTTEQIIPFEAAKTAGSEPVVAGVSAQFLYEPDEGTLLEALLPKNLQVQIYRALLETYASEQGARMTAMDSATRNAGDMIRKLDLTYNRARQAYITKELIEIISGAEAL